MRCRLSNGSGSKGGGRAPGRRKRKENLLKLLAHGRLQKAGRAV